MVAADFRAKARANLTGKWGKAALLMLVYIILIAIVSFVLNLIPVVGSLAYAVISVPLSFGLVVTYMKLKRGEDVTYTEFFNNGFNAFGRVWGVVLWTFVKLLAPTIIMIIAMIIMAFGGTMLGVGSLADSGSASASVLGGIIFVLGLVGTIGSSIWLTVKSYLYKLTMYLLNDNPTMSSKEVVEESARLMQGNRWRLFCLEFSFIGWAILASFTFGIGMLWLAPYMVVAEIEFYENLSGNKVEAQVEPETNVDPIQ